MSPQKGKKKKKKVVFSFLLSGRSVYNTILFSHETQEDSFVKDNTEVEWICSMSDLYLTFIQLITAGYTSGSKSGFYIREVFFRFRLYPLIYSSTFIQAFRVFFFFPVSYLLQNYCYARTVLSRLILIILTGECFGFQ